MESFGLFVAGGALVNYSPVVGGALVIAGSVLCLALGAKPSRDE